LAYIISISYYWIYNTIADDPKFEKIIPWLLFKYFKYMEWNQEDIEQKIINQDPLVDDESKIPLTEGDELKD
jgi:hypothetical protein